MNDSTRTPSILKTWKVRATAKGCVLTINGNGIELGPTLPAVAFALQQIADGANPVEQEHADI